MTGHTAGPAGSPLERKAPLLGAGAVAVAALSAVLAWRGGLWLLPVAVALVVATVRRSRSTRGAPRRVGLALAGLAAVVGAWAFVSAGGVQPALRTGGAAYQPGDEVQVQIKAGLRAVGYNLCSDFVHLQQRVGDNWEPGRRSLGPPPEDGVMWACTAELRILPPLLGATGAIHLPPDLEQGTYRLVTDAEVAGERRPVATNAFVVAARPGEPNT